MSLVSSFLSLVYRLCFLGRTRPGSLLIRPGEGRAVVPLPPTWPLWLRFRFRAPSHHARTVTTTIIDGSPGLMPTPQPHLRDDSRRGSTNAFREVPPSIAYARDSMPHTSRTRTRGGCNLRVREASRERPPRGISLEEGTPQALEEWMSKTPCDLSGLLAAPRPTSRVSTHGGFTLGPCGPHPSPSNGVRLCCRRGKRIDGRE